MFVYGFSGTWWTDSSCRAQQMCLRMLWLRKRKRKAHSAETLSGRKAIVPWQEQKLEAGLALLVQAAM